MAVPAALAVMGALSAVSSMGSAISNSQKAKEQLKLQQEAFDFVKQMNAENKAMWAKELADFESVFGDIERTLSTYYNNLTADKAIASGMQEIAKSYSTAKAELNAELAQRGLYSSGAAAAGFSNLANQRAAAEASVRKNAQAEVMAAKSKWLNTGLAQKSQALQGMSNAYSRSASTGMNLAGVYGNAADSYGKAASSSMSALGSSIGSIASAGLKYGAMGENGSGEAPSPAVDPNIPWYMKNWNGGN